MHSDGTVDNVIAYDPDGDWRPPDHLTVRVLTDNEVVGPGHRWDGNQWVAPVTSTDVATVVVEVDPAALDAAISAATKATTVTSLRTALVNALVLLSPES